MSSRSLPADRLHHAFVLVARRHWKDLAMADTTGQKLTYGRALIGAFAFARALAQRTKDEPVVGTLLPASVGGALANIAILLAGKLPINLNFTIGEEPLQAAITQAKIRTIVTSRRFLEKAGLPERPGMLFLEDLRQSIGGVARIRALLAARFTSLASLRRRDPQPADGSPALATIIFSSGSTGLPKGVMLTHANILANVESLMGVFPLSTQDRVIGVLPFFHSFGFMGTLWFPLLQGAAVAYHPNPMDAKTIGELAGEYRATLLISTPTFCNSYIRRCTPEQFAHLQWAIVGAEKLRPQIAKEFKERFGIDLLEGYGCTEMSPVVAVNRPPSFPAKAGEVWSRPGSIGRPVPGVEAKIVDRETGALLGVGEEGLLLVRGPSVMLGYLDAPERTAEAMRDGWYVTGDIGTIDRDGFIFITDRVSRFSKVGGEMVPHIRVEDAINEVLEGAYSAVTALPDAVKGEKLVAFYTRPDVTPDALWERLSKMDLPRLWLPKRENLFYLESLPVLGTGKTDLRRLVEFARECAGATE